MFEKVYIYKKVDLIWFDFNLTRSSDQIYETGKQKSGMKLTFPLC